MSAYIASHQMWIEMQVNARLSHWLEQITQDLFSPNQGVFLELSGKIQRGDDDEEKMPSWTRRSKLCDFWKGRWGYWCDHVNKDYRLCLALLGCTGLYRAVVGCTLLYSAILGWTGVYWTVLDCTGLYWAVLGCSGLYWTVLGCTGLYWAVLGVKRWRG